MRNKQTAVWTTAAVGALALSGMAFSGSWADSPEPGPPADPHLRALSKASQTAADKLPAVVTENEHLNDLDQGSSRALKAADRNDYWVVRNDAGEICLVAETPDEVAGATCTEPRDFNAHGLGLQVLTPDHGLEAYLLPDDVARDANLVTVDPFGMDKQRAAAKGYNDSAAKDAQFQLRILPVPEGAGVPLGLQADGN